jgi:hypothetical protein
MRIHHASRAGRVIGSVVEAVPIHHKIISRRAAGPRSALGGESHAVGESLIVFVLNYREIHRQTATRPPSPADPERSGTDLAVVLGQGR